MLSLCCSPVMETRPWMMVVEGGSRGLSDALSLLPVLFLAVTGYTPDASLPAVMCAVPTQRKVETPVGWSCIQGPPTGQTQLACSCTQTQNYAWA